MHKYPCVYLFLFLLLIVFNSGISLDSNNFDSDNNISKNHVVNVKKLRQSFLTLETPFNFPVPSPVWPQGEGFATGTIDLGGLITSEVTSFGKIWTTFEGGPNNNGATFFEPIGIPDGFSLLGYYVQPNNRALFGRVVVAKDKNSSSPALKSPKDYALVWNSKNLNVNEDNNGYIWAPIPFDGYQAVGLVVTTTGEKPSVNKVMCVRSDLTDPCEADEWIWGRGGDSGEFNVFETRPVDRGNQASAVSIGTFMTRSGGGTTSDDTPLLACLKNTLKGDSYMPNLDQLNTLINSYSPRIYAHPHEQYLPSSVDWFFSNGALLFQKGNESNPIPIDPTGSNLPQNGPNDGSYWIDLPPDKNTRERVMQGDIASANAYFHVKQMLGGTYTDIAIWLFYPFNGGASAKVGLITLSLGKIGEHVGDWEHVTLRISNFNGMLRKVFFAQHAGGEWIHASNLEYIDNTNRFFGYASLHGHAIYAHAEDGKKETGFIVIKNDTDKSDKIIDTANNYKIISANYIASIIEPFWLNYTKKWGPLITYDIGDEINKVAKFLPRKLKNKLLTFTKNLPPELLGEEGPTGPKVKRSWDGDESN